MSISAIGAIAAGTSLASAVYGAIKSANYNKKAAKLIGKQRDDNRRWYDAGMREDYTNRTDAQAVINKQRELLEAQTKRIRATNAVAGGSDESAALAQASANNATAQTMADISAQAASHKDQIEQSYRQQDAALNQQQAQILSGQGQSTAQAAGQAVNAGVNLLGNELALKKSNA